MSPVRRSSVRSVLSAPTVWVEAFASLTGLTYPLDLKASCLTNTTCLRSMDMTVNILTMKQVEPIALSKFNVAGCVPPNEDPVWNTQFHRKYPYPSHGRFLGSFISWQLKCFCSPFCIIFNCAVIVIQSNTSVVTLMSYP